VVSGSQKKGWEEGCCCVLHFKPSFNSLSLVSSFYRLLCCKSPLSLPCQCHPKNPLQQEAQARVRGDKEDGSGLGLAFCVFRGYLRAQRPRPQQKRTPIPLSLSRLSESGLLALLRAAGSDWKRARAPSAAFELCYIADAPTSPLGAQCNSAREGFLFLKLSIYL
jgi:hypothetical protein